MAGYDNKARRPFLRPAACLRLDSEQRKGQQTMASGTVSSTVFRMPEDGIPSLDGEDVAVFVGVCPNEDLPFFEKQIVDKAVSTIVVLFDPTDELGGGQSGETCPGPSGVSAAAASGRTSILYLRSGALEPVPQRPPARRVCPFPLSCRQASARPGRPPSGDSSGRRFVLPRV